MAARSSDLTRRALLGFGLAAPAVLAACGRDDAKWNAVNVTGSAAPLKFDMTRARDGEEVDEREYRDKVALLYFGYTFCPDVCPLTLANLAQAMAPMGELADRVRVLFVTVDPNRDTLPVLKQYVESFGPNFVGLRGSDDKVASLTRRYRIAYSVTPAHDGKPYEVSHSSAVYAFDATGAAKAYTAEEWLTS